MYLTIDLLYISDKLEMVEDMKPMTMAERKAMFEAASKP